LLELARGERLAASAAGDAHHHAGQQAQGVAMRGVEHDRLRELLNQRIVLQDVQTIHDMSEDPPELLHLSCMTPRGSLPKPFNGARSCSPVGLVDMHERSDDVI
jgi:hypothetical protein